MDYKRGETGRELYKIKTIIFIWEIKKIENNHDRLIVQELDIRLFLCFPSFEKNHKNVLFLRKYIYKIKSVRKGKYIDLQADAND